MGDRVQQVINSKGCSRLFGGISISSSSSSSSLSSSSVSFRDVLQPVEPLSPATRTGPFSGLIICVTGLSKEARKQVKDATERLGGQYSPNLHPQCTHLVVQSFHGHKFEHAVKHGLRNCLFLVTLGWFVDSIRKNVRLSESLYSVKTADENAMPMDDLYQLSQFGGSKTSCLPVSHEPAKQFDMPIPFPEKVPKRSGESSLSGLSFYIDLDSSPELRHKVVKAAASVGAKVLDQWFVGCSASHVVCEGPSVQKYIGHSSNLVTPLWVLKTTKEKRIQRLVHMSADMARQVGIMLDDAQIRINKGCQDINGDNCLQDVPCSRSKLNHEEREKIVNMAKDGVRKRRYRMQTCQTSMHPITPSSLLDSICWSVSEPTSTACIYTDSISVEDTGEYQTSVSFYAKCDGKESESSFVNFSRPLTESEKSEIVFRNHIFTILFPVDRFTELGPCSRTFFSDEGFTCLQVLDHIYAFYQENMSDQEIQVAIHTDSRHADRLRAVYSSKETSEQGYVVFKRIDFLGSRKSFEMLKRVNGDNSSNVYELLIRA